MTAYCLVVRKRTRHVRAERDVTFGTFIVSCDILSADDALTTGREDFVTDNMPS